jgi:hypothetical protein
MAKFKDGDLILENNKVIDFNGIKVRAPLSNFALEDPIYVQVKADGEFEINNYVDPPFDIDPETYFTGVNQGNIFLMNFVYDDDVELVLPPAWTTAQIDKVFRIRLNNAMPSTTLTIKAIDYSTLFTHTVFSFEHKSEISPQTDIWCAGGRLYPPGGFYGDFFINPPTTLINADPLKYIMSPELNQLPDVPETITCIFINNANVTLPTNYYVTRRQPLMLTAMTTTTITIQEPTGKFRASDDSGNKATLTSGKSMLISGPSGYDYNVLGYSGVVFSP